MGQFLQTTDTILMVRPAHFGFNEQTADNNAFQTNDGSLSPVAIQERAVAEFDAFVAKLRAAGVQVIVVADTADPVKTDAVFPNNWISFHADGLVVTYPMYAPVRRLERRADLIDQLSEQFEIRQHLRFEGHEAEERYLEGTGSMILDREHQLVYACKSVRTDMDLLDQWCQAMQYRAVAFTATDGQGQEIYHTNVMMALGESFAVICLDTIKDEAERNRVLAALAEAQKAVIDISLAQMQAFAGNMLQVRNGAGDTFLVMSSQAFQALRPEQVAEIVRHTSILHSALDTIETYGGGSARCMMAEVFLPRK